MSVGATRNQTITTGALGTLGFEVVPSEVVGGPVQMTVTDEALDALKGKTVEVDGEGKVKIL